MNPNHIGVDIGCGMLCAEIESTITPDMYIDIDQRIREVVPMGFEVHDIPEVDGMLWPLRLIPFKPKRYRKMGYVWF